MIYDTRQTALEQFTHLLGKENVITHEAEKKPYLVEWRDRYFGAAAAILKPGTVEDVAAIVKIAAETEIGLVPQGGNTGLVGAQIAFDACRQFVVSMSRLNEIRALDPLGNTMTLDAGVVLEVAQNAAHSVDRLLALRIGSQGSCQIGGNLSSNAGGTNVVAYGNARDQALGLEVVLPNGTIIHDLNRLRKNNTGYDLKNLFIGAEGTLGFITGAVLKLFPKPKGTQTSLLAFGSLEQAGMFFNMAKDQAAGGLTGFEIMPHIGMEFVDKHAPNCRNPLSRPYPWYALVELSSHNSQSDAETKMITLVEYAIAQDGVSDGVIATSKAQEAEFWALREALSACQKGEGGSIKTDISVPVDMLPRFISEACAAVKAYMPTSRPCPFGHWGDGNIHFNISQPIGMDQNAFLAHWDKICDIVHAVTLSYDGSISAEHGIGIMKRDKLPKIKDPASLALMRTIKNSLDPKGIMNPGKVF